MELPSSPFSDRLLAGLGLNARSPLGRLVIQETYVIAARIAPDTEILESGGGAKSELVRRRGPTVGRRVREVYADLPAVVAAVDRALAGQEVRERLDVSGMVLDVVLKPQRDGAGRVTEVYAVAVPVDGPPADPAATLAAAGLTARQAEVACALARDGDPARAAARLNISRSALDNHIAPLKRRLLGREPSRAKLGEVIAYVRDQGWGTLPLPGDDPTER